MTTFTYPSFEQPPQLWPMNFADGSLAAQDPSFAQISLTYDYDKFVSERIILSDDLTYVSIESIDR